MPRTRRPMTEMTGVVSDLQPQDYVDMVGGQGWKLMRVGALVHKVDHLPRRQVTTDLAHLIPGTVDVTFDMQATSRVEFLGIGGVDLNPNAPVQFRRFAD